MGSRTQSNRVGQWDDGGTMDGAMSSGYRTAVSRACASQSIATIGPNNLTHVKKLYTPTVSLLGYPHPSSFPTHQTYSLPGNICDTIQHAACNKGAGINADSIDLFSLLLSCSILTVCDDLQFIFDLIYKNKLPDSIKRYFTDFTYSAYIKIHLTPRNYDPLVFLQRSNVSLLATLHTRSALNLPTTFFPTNMLLAFQTDLTL
jgi:hypothetical protein